MELQLNGLEAGVRRSLCWCHEASLASCGLARCRELLLPPLLHQFTPGVRTQCMSTEAAAYAVSRLPDTSLREVELSVCRCQLANLSRVVHPTSTSVAWGMRGCRCGRPEQAAESVALIYKYWRHASTGYCQPQASPSSSRFDTIPTHAPAAGTASRRLEHHNGIWIHPSFVHFVFASRPRNVICVTRPLQ